MKFFTSLIMLALITCYASAEQVSVPIGQQGSNKQSITRPHQGMTKSQVKKQFGEPRHWKEPVGDPPISSWQYDNFTVYFEYNHVIHSVIKH